MVWFLRKEELSHKNSHDTPGKNFFPIDREHVGNVTSNRNHAAAQQLRHRTKMSLFQFDDEKFHPVNAAIKLSLKMWA